MDEPRTGGCECGALRYQITADPIAVAACHCTQCQRQSGSAFSMSMIVPRDGFSWLAGKPKTFRTKSDSGADKDCIFCAECGIRIYNALSSMPATLNVKPGTLDQTSGFEPSLHVWLSSKQAWVPVPETAARFDHNPSQSGGDSVE